MRMRDRAEEERQQRVAVVGAAAVSVVFGALWLAGLGWADGLALGFGGFGLGMALGYLAPRVLRPGLPRIALLIAAAVAFVVGIGTGVVGFTGPSEMFFWAGRLSNPATHGCRGRGATRA